MGIYRVGDQNIDITLAVGPGTGDAPVQEVTISGSVTATFDIKTGSSLQFVVRGYAPEAAYIDELATDIWLMGDIKARFRALAVWQEWFQNGQDNVSVLGVSYRRLLNRRLANTPLAFNDTDLGLVIWGMWEHTQSLPGGDLGITLGTPNTTGIVRTRTYDMGENLGQQAEEETDEGVWWMIDENLVYTAGLTDSRPMLPTPLQLGVNVREMQRAAGGDFANVVYGDADASRTTGVLAVASDIATDPRGRWETAKGWPTVKLQSTLDERTYAALAEGRRPATHWNVEMEPARWISDSRIMPGDFAVLTVPRSLAAPIGTPVRAVVVQVHQVSVSFDENGALGIKAIVHERPDRPLPTTFLEDVAPKLIGV
jgi:hypothetical protein